MRLLSGVLPISILLIFVVCGCQTEELLSNNRDKGRVESEELREKRLREFQYCEVVPRYPFSDKHNGDYCFMHLWGKAPDIVWKKPYFVEQVMGKFPLTVRWFDSELNEVTDTNKPGRYGVVVEGTTPDGIHIRRGLTIYSSTEWFPFIVGYGPHNT